MSATYPYVEALRAAAAAGWQLDYQPGSAYEHFPLVAPVRNVRGALQCRRDPQLRNCSTSWWIVTSDGDCEHLLGTTPEQWL